MWTYNSVFYQIYPIGFCGAPVHNDGVTVPRIRKIMEARLSKRPRCRFHFIKSNL